MYFLLKLPLARARVCVCVCVLSCFSRVRLFGILLTIASQASLSMGFSRQEYWTGLPFPPPGDLPHPGIKPTSPVSPALAGRFFTTESPGKLRSLYTGTRLPGHQSSLLPSKAAPGLAPAPCRRNESSFLSWTGDLHPGLSPQLTNRI